MCVYVGLRTLRWWTTRQRFENSHFPPSCKKTHKNVIQWGQQFASRPFGKFKQDHLACRTISHTVKDRANDYYCQHILSRLWTCYVHIYIWHRPIINFKIKVRHVSTANLSQTLTDRANIHIILKYKVICWLSINKHLTLVKSQDKGQHCAFRMQIFRKR